LALPFGFGDARGGTLDFVVPARTEDDDEDDDSFNLGFGLALALALDLLGLLAV